MKAKIRTEVDIKYFGERAKIENKSFGGYDERYVYQISFRDTKYILKGFKIELEHLNPECYKSVNMFKGSIYNISEVFQEYYLSQMASKLSPHFAAPLSMDFVIEPTASMEKCSYMFIEIIFEYGGIGLNIMKPMTLELAYNAMKQSADAMLQLHNSGIAHFDFKPANMLYNDKKDLLKVIDMKGAFSCANYKELSAPIITFNGKIRRATLEYAPPEVLLMVESFSIDRSLMLSVPAVDVYCWAMTFFDLLTNKSNAELRMYYKKYKSGSEGDYNDFIEIVENNLNSIKTKNTKEENLKKIITDLLIKALAYKPMERPEIKDVISKMKKFEETTKNAHPKLRFLY